MHGNVLAYKRDADGRFFYLIGLLIRRYRLNLARRSKHVLADEDIGGSQRDDRCPPEVGAPKRDLSLHIVIEI